MNFISKLFGRKSSTAPTVKKRPENTKLLFLINNWLGNPSDSNFRAVVEELQTGNSFLLLPTINDEQETTDWTTLEAGATLKLTSVVDMDGFKAIGAFTDEKSMAAWTKSVTQFTAMKSSDILAFCKENRIDRIVINSDQPNMFVLQWGYQDISTTKIDENTKVQVGTPANPLPKHLIEKLNSNFQKVPTIEEAYQYVMNMNGEVSLVVGAKLSVVSEESRVALQNAIGVSIEGEKLDLPLDVLVLEDEEWLQTVRNIEDSLLYKRNS